MRGGREALASRMDTVEFLARLEDHLATRLSELDLKEHPSSGGPSRLTRQWTIEFIAAEAARHSDFANLAALLRTVNEQAPPAG